MVVDGNKMETLRMGYVPHRGNQLTIVQGASEIETDPHSRDHEAEDE